jgi:hypothetical protein
MLEALRSEVNLPALFVMLAFLFGAGTAGLWYVRKTTGRSVREMLALLAAAVVLISLMMVSFVAFHGWLDSPDGNTRRIANRLLRWGMLPVAVVVWWLFNNLAKAKGPRNHLDS